MMAVLSRFLDDFTHLFFPFQCAGCDRALREDEKTVCKNCLDHLPKTRYWELAENPVEKLFWGKLKLVRACSFVYFTKGGAVQSMLHALKYRKQREVGTWLGAQFGTALSLSKYTDIDVIVPVPLHQSKRKKRGYNQCEPIGEQMALAMGKVFLPNALVRLTANESQTRKSRYERWLNVKELFQVSQHEAIEGKHVLLIDDVVTTGATIEACAGAVLQVPGARVSIATIACPSPV